MCGVLTATVDEDADESKEDEDEEAEAVNKSKESEGDSGTEMDNCTKDLKKLAVDDAKTEELSEKTTQPDSAAEKPTEAGEA